MKQGLTIFFVGWLFIITSLFYWAQQPLTVQNLLAVADVVGNLFVVSWILLLGAAVGTRLLGWLNIDSAPTQHSEYAILAPGLGLGSLGLLILAIGLAGGLYTSLFWLLTVGLTIVLRSDLRRWFRQITRWPDLPRLARWYLAAWLMITLPIALLPPTDWDGLFYHLTAPKRYAASHQISGGIDVPHFNFPFGPEMLFLYGLLLKGEVVAKLIHFLFGLLLIGLVYQTGRRHLHVEAGWRGLLTLLSIPSLSILATWAYTDLALAFYQLAAVYALLNHFEAQQTTTSHKFSHWLIVSGLFAGLAMGVKYTSVVTPVVIGLMVLGEIAHPKADRFTKTGRSALQFSLPALLVASPWYLKNLWFTGNPVYPFVFGGQFWDEFRAAWYSQAGTGIGWDVGQLVLLPLLSTLGLFDSTNLLDGRIGPLYLIFLPLLILYGLFRYRPLPKAAKTLLLFAFAHYLFWIIGVIWSKSLWQTRLLLPGLVIVTPVIGWLWYDLAHLKQRHFSPQRFVSLLIGLVLIFNLVDLTFNSRLGVSLAQYQPLAYLTGQESREAYLTRRLGTHYQALQNLNDTVPADGAVLFLWEPRSYFCERRCLPDPILERLAHAHHLHETPAEIVAAWRAQGFSHVLLNQDGVNFLLKNEPQSISPQVQATLNTLRAEHLRLISSNKDSYLLFELR